MRFLLHCRPQSKLLSCLEAKRWFLGKMKVISFEGNLFEGIILFFWVSSFKLSYPINYSIPPGIAKPGLPLPHLPWPTYTFHSRKRKLSKSPWVWRSWYQDGPSREIFKTDSTSQGLSELTPFKPERDNFSLMLPLRFSHNIITLCPSHLENISSSWIGNQDSSSLSELLMFDVFSYLILLALPNWVKCFHHYR